MIHSDLVTSKSACIGVETRRDCFNRSHGQIVGRGGSARGRQTPWGHDQHFAAPAGLLRVDTA